MYPYVLLSTIFFHRGDMIPAYEFTHYPCAIEPLHISGLTDQRAYAQSKDLFLYEDRIIYHLSPKQTQFEIRRKEDDTLIDTLFIRWKTDCIKETETSTNPQTSQPVNTSAIVSTIPETVTFPASAATSIPPIIVSDPTTAKANLRLYGLNKRTIYQNEIFNPLQDIYLYDQNGTDHSHKLQHSPFQADEIGTHYIEIRGRVGEDIVAGILEIEVLLPFKKTNKINLTFIYLIGTITTFCCGGLIVWLKKRF